MVFLNFILAGGLAVVSAPVVIHLMRRRRIRKMKWGAMMFLDELVAEQSKQIKAREFLLLLVRTGIVACLVLAMMRPVVQMFTPPLHKFGSHSSTVILLDDSFSMKAGRVRTAWRKARELSLRYIDTLDQGDDVTIFFTSKAGKEPPPPALFDLERVREIIREAQPSHEAANWPRAVGAAMEHLERRHNSRKNMILFTDLQAHGWDLADTSKWSFLETSIQENRFKTNIILVSVTQQRPENIALLELSSTRGIVDPFSPATFHTTVSNEGPEDAEDIAVIFKVDGIPKATKSLRLPVGGRETLSFQHQFKESGSHYVSCKLRSAHDTLGEDNEIHHSVLVTAHLPVLLVDGRPSSEPLKSETSFLRLALSPPDTDDPNWNTVIEPDVIDAPRLRNTDFSKYRVVVLANIPALHSSVISELERFVMSGGGLLITAGDRIQREAYNRDLYRQGAGLLPTRFTITEKLEHGKSANQNTKTSKPMHTKDKPAHVTTTETRLASIVSSIPALNMFKAGKDSRWNQGRIYSFLKTEPVQILSRARLLATYSNGSAALLQKTMGEGKVTLFTTAIDMDWSNLPAQTFFVPLMQSLIFDLASAISPPRNLSVGQDLSHITWTTISPEASPGQNKVMLLRPKEDPVPLKAQRQGAYSIYSSGATRTPGLYTVSVKNESQDQKTYYTVNANRAESGMDRLTDQSIERLQNQMGISLVKGWSGLAHVTGLDTGGWELSRVLIALAIALCFAELYLTRRWT